MTQQQTNIFNQLGLGQEYKDSKSLFESKESKINGDNSVERIKFVLKTYSKWIKAKRNKHKINVNMYDLINIGFGKTYGMNGFLRDYIYVTHTNRGCFGYDNINNNENETKSKDFECDIDTCFIVSRSNRNKNKMR
eukprot:265834_1